MPDPDGKPSGPPDDVRGRSLAELIEHLAVLAARQARRRETPQPRPDPAESPPRPDGPARGRT